MAFSRRLGVVSILSACWFVAVACNDDEDRVPGTDKGGEAGEGSGGGGKSAGGAANNAGKGGKGGSAGSSGSGTSGDAGNGSGGEAGGGGIVAGAGGEGTAGAGEGGAAGGGGAATAGAGGEGGSPAPQSLSCAYECTPGTDCLLANGTVPCDAVTQRCVVTEQLCEVKDDCAPFANLFWLPCETSADCASDGSESCINWQGKGTGYCALLDVGGCLAGVSTSAAELGGNGNVDVCVEQGVCKAGECDFACNHDFAQPCVDSGNGDTCNPTTGRCECADPSECDSNACGADSHCAECATSQDCAGAQFGLDTCIDGKCGCSATNVCPNQFTNATAVCE